jgi:hypothetical protein
MRLMPSSAFAVYILSENLFKNGIIEYEDDDEDEYEARQLSSLSYSSTSSFSLSKVDY